MSNEVLYKRAMDAITALFSDDSVSTSKAKENMRSLCDEIEMLIDSLGDDNES